MGTSIDAPTKVLLTYHKWDAAPGCVTRDEGREGIVTGPQCAWSAHCVPVFLALIAEPTGVHHMLERNKYDEV